MRRIAKLASLVVLLTAWNGASSAANRVLVTYEGVIASGTDQSDTWKTGSKDLAGALFSLTYSFDLKQGTSTSYLQQQGPGQDNDILGGVAYLGPGFATLTIGGTSESFEGVGSHKVDWDLEDFLYLPTSTEQLDSKDGVYQVNTVSSSYAIPYYLHIDTPFSFDDLSTPIDPSGRFNFEGQGISTSGLFDATSVMVTSVVPEPTTWAFLVIGLGLAGLFRRAPIQASRDARHRRRTA